MILVTGTGSTSVDIAFKANLELVDKFCYLGEMLSVDGDDDAAVENRIQIGWNKFRQSINQSIKVICNARNVVHKLESEARELESEAVGTIAYK